MITKKKKILHQLFIELVKLQKEVIASDLKLLIILEGRDAAGKDGTIKRIIKHLSPRETIVVALGKPTDLQEREWYFQRYTAHLPASGEFVLFNRSWYNRLGVEKVMGFCSKKEYESFFSEVDLFENGLADAGFIILKYYLDISKEEQQKRLESRKTDPLKQWKISPIDEVAEKHWKDYSEARDEMLLKTNFNNSPWFVVSADHKKATHIALITHLLNRIKYKNKNEKLLSENYGLVDPATPEIISNKLF
ncbi:polyphosphate kinase 2 [Kaistella flava (ex Peng et al. 2021)]|uniref:ADP/GDP-polyphosphate phosphotransferase n=1 Tax=Kaistella flava (ex Peng et al. 2021) TaxID=2038776 RepID=A0A7M2YDU9_9FLAO|nr:polyphosphate kinase 2 [Kaistella flava (ex Peng et al. 2021)]QOW11824.1 polyphosphate kinase 2 [Kaistella flava (ex Peng et al. 2021)]